MEIKTDIGMDNRKIQRLKIMDEMFSQGEWVSFEDVRERLDKIFYRILDPYFDGDMDRAYGSNFRSDIRIIRGILKDPKLNLDPGMLETTGSKRYMKYRYKIPGFRISPFLEYQYTAADYKKLDKALKMLGDNLPADVYEGVEFAIRSRIEYDFGKGQKNIDYNDNLRLKGRQWLPFIYRSINKTVLQVTYSTFDGESETYTIHPYLLRYFNERWFMFGYRQDKENLYWNAPIDRIANIVELDEETFVPRPEKYISHFDTFIGVTDLPRVGLEKERAFTDDILIRIHNRGAWGRSITKPLHSSQKITTDFNGKFGEIMIHVVPNNEMFTRILSLGEHVSVISPYYIRQEMISIIKQLASLY